MFAGRKNQETRYVQTVRSQTQLYLSEVGTRTGLVAKIHLTRQGSVKIRGWSQTWTKPVMRCADVLVTTTPPLLLFFVLLSNHPRTWGALQVFTRLALSTTYIHAEVRQVVEEKQLMIMSCCSRQHMILSPYVSEMRRS